MYNYSSRVCSAYPDIASVSFHGVTVSVAVFLDPWKVAVRVAVTVLATWAVWKANVILVFPSGTVTLAGTIAAGLLLLRKTFPLPPDAGKLSVTLAEVLLPPTTLVGPTINSISTVLVVTVSETVAE